MYENFKQYPFYIIYHIYLVSNVSKKKINETLLYDHYFRNWNTNKKDLIPLQILEKRLRNKHLSIKEQYILGEYYRLSRNFIRAKNIFTKLSKSKKLKEHLKNMIFCQLNLIKNKKSKIFYNCSEYKETIPILDNVNINITQEPFEELDTFIQDIIYSNRENEFETGLLKYKKSGLNLRIVNSEEDNLLSLLLLHSNVRASFLNNKASTLFKMIQIALKKFNINPFILSGLVCCNLTGYGYTILSEIVDGYNIDKRLLVCFFEKIRKLFLNMHCN